jgi:carbamoyl-phosphate synthase / aspartate carbamoyltransferase
MPLGGQGDERRPLTPNTRANLHVDPQLPSSPSSAASVGLSASGEGIIPAGQLRPPSGRPTATLIRTVSAQTVRREEKKVYLELKDGIVYEGFSFGSEHSAAGELVFQTGMVGYPESITDPSYRGQLLVMTFPLVGNYGVPSRKVIDEVLLVLPKYFESSEIHVAGLIVASYCGEDFSHYLADSSLGKWLRENDIPAMHGVDTRALTIHIREVGSVLGRMLHQKRGISNGLPDGDHPLTRTKNPEDGPWISECELIDWIDPNAKILVRDGRQPTGTCSGYVKLLTARSFRHPASAYVSTKTCSASPSVWSACSSHLSRCRAKI